MIKHAVVAAALALAFGAATLPTTAETTSSVAPADHYFGRMQMSILEIRNRLKDLSRLADARPEEAAHVFDRAVLLEDALMSWAKQFPHDPWIPKFTFGLAQLYGKLDLDEARTRKMLMLDWLSGTYPNYDSLLHL
jgi:hypothetical protein